MHDVKNIYQNPKIKYNQISENNMVQPLLHSLSQ